jgi:hypothetical protein
MFLLEARKRRKFTYPPMGRRYNPTTSILSRTMGGMTRIWFVTPASMTLLLSRTRVSHSMADRLDHLIIDTDVEIASDEPVATPALMEQRAEMAKKQAEEQERAKNPDGEPRVPVNSVCESKESISLVDD